MKIERSEAYEGPALTWLLGEVDRLREALVTAQISAEAQRSVCESFFFGLCYELDDGRSSSRIRLAFESEHAVLLPDNDTFAFHEYAMGVVGESFGTPDRR